MAYDFIIESQEELDSLGWIADRYDYAEAIERALVDATPIDWEANEGPYPVTFDISEPAAWSIQEAVEAEDGYLTCMGGRLREEVQRLLDRIV
jgi:hypothetical protein